MSSARLRLAARRRGLALAAALAASACGRAAPPPSIVLVSIDTLRADHLPVYGYARDTAPALTAFAAEAVRFEQAIAQSSGTLPSHLSLITSLNPPHFRIVRDDGQNDTQMKTRLQLPDPVVTLTEVLADHGYDTAAFTDGAFMQPEFGFGQGFDVFRTNLYSDDKRSFGLFFSVTKLERFLEERRGGASGSGAAEARRPLFLFVHSYDVHSPYDSPPPYERWFSDRSHAELAADLGFEPEPVRMRRHLDEISPRDAETVRGLYDNGIRKVDDQMARLFALLREHDLFEDAIVVVLSDHGDEFLEHGSFGHGQSVHAELLRVPLLIRLPAARHAGLSRATPVALVDVAPTLLELVGVPVPASFAGRSLVPLIEGEDDADFEERPIYFETPGIDRGSYGLQRGRWKVIRDWKGGEMRVYDLEADPGERRDRVREQSPLAARLSAELSDWVREMEQTGSARDWSARLPGAPPAPPVARERERELRALGYVVE
jgi:arylsulfatase A-like enzyme